MEIKPGIGIGVINFGIAEEELIKLLGKPHYVKCGEYVKGSGDSYRELIYLKGLSLTFDSGDNYRLGTVSVNDNGYKVYGRDLIGLPINVVKYFMSKQVAEVPKYEDCSSIESPKKWPE